MILFLVWTFFVFSMSLVKELDQIHYILFSVLMLHFIYFYDQVYSIKISFRTNVCFLLIPSTIFWYIAFVYNNFLCLTPINHEVLISMLLFYTYVIMYILWEYP